MTLIQALWIEVSAKFFFRIAFCLSRINFLFANVFVVAIVGSLSSYHPLDTTHVNDFSSRVKQEIKVKQEPMSESIPSTSSHQALASTTLRSLNIEDEIARLYAQLPPIDFEAAALDTFEEYNNVDVDGDVVECTCTFREVITYLGDDEVAAAASTVDAPFNEPPRIDVNIIKNGTSEKLDDSDDDETDDFCAVDDVVEDDEHVKSPPPMRGGAVKSIFDPDYDANYDANENLIEEMVRRKPRLNAPKVIEVKIMKGAVKPSRIEPLLIQPEPTPEVERVPIINYECEEDPMCPARVHFQREPVTSKDVDRLHKNNISGVNGFWNGISEDRPTQDYKKDMENIDYAKHQLWKRVVPRYDFLTCDKIPKTFNDTRFSHPPPPPPEDDTAKPSDGAMNCDIEFREWHEMMNVRSYNDDVLTILPYVIID